MVGATVQAQVSGKVFRDYNGSGSRDSTSTPLFREIGVADVTVTATNGVLTSTTTTGSFGDYAFPNAGATASGQKVRIEFSTIPTGSFSGFHGITNTFSGTSVQFVTAGTAARANLGINIPEEYCQPNPLIALACYENGNAVYTASGNTNPGFITLPYNSSGSARTEMSSNIQILQIGTTWGNAWQKVKKRVFTSAVLKRHSGLGPQGLGGLYMIDYSTSVGGTFLNEFNLQGITPGNGGAAIDLGSVNRTGANALPNNTTDDSRDIDAFGKVAKVGFGGIDIADNDQFLWMVNLNQKALIRMDVSADTPTPSTATVNQYPIANFSGLPTCTNGELRPWALKFHGGKGYLGLVCSAEGTNGVVANLQAYVLSFNPSNPTAFTTELSFPLNYTREAATVFSSSLSGNWNPWADTWAETGLTGGSNVNSFNERVYAQPVLSDIEFSDTGLDIGILDRFGLQGGFRNFTPQASPTTLYISADAAGDIIHYCKIGDNYVQEGSTGCAVLDNTTNSTLANDGPGGNGEFYYAESYNDTGANPTFNHNETSLGGLAVLKGSQEIINIVYDPISGTQDATAFTQGLHWYNTSTGAKTDQYLIVPNATNNPRYFGKAGGLGDPELLCNPAPLEIGNRVWKDSDNDGIQDADENGVNGVEIELYKGATLLATVTTATIAGQSGTWYFSSKSHLGNAWVGTGADTTLLPATSYSIKVKTTLGAGALANCTAFSPKGATTGGIDSDINPDATLSYTTGNYGENNHTLDIGVTECIPPVITATSAQILCQGETAGAFTMNITSGTVSSQKWYGPIANNLPATSLGTAITGATSTTFTPSAAQLPAADGVTRYYAVVGESSSPTCSDTAYVAITVNPKPDAGNPQTVCAGTTATLTGTSPTTGTWTAQVSPANPAGAILGSTAAGVANVSFAANSSGIFKFVYTANGCTDTLQITVNAKPNAGADITGGSAICNSVAAVDLPNAANGETWSQLGNTPKAVTINPSTGAVSGMDAIGAYQFILKNTATNCADTVSVEVKNCLKGSLGDLVWKDANDNGIQDLPAEKGVPGIIVQLLNGDNNSLITADTTDDNGIYGFPGLTSGNYKVKIVLSSLPDTCQISPKQDVNTGDGNDTNDSDFNPTTGESPVIVIDVTKTGIDKDNPTIDAALFVPCLKPAAGTDAAICQGITTIDLKNAGADELWSKGAQPANTTANINASTGLVTGLSSPGDYYFILTYKANATCSDTVKVTVNAKPNAGADITGGNAICNSVAAVDLPNAANGETWSQLGNTPKAVTINPSTGAISGMDAIGIYQFILKNTTTECADTVSVEIKNCAKGSIGDLVWKDRNDNGIQDLPAEQGVQGVIVQLLNGDNNSLITADTTDANGIYSFTGLNSGNYKIKILTSSLPDTCQISPKQDVNTGDGNDTNDSDFNPTTGESPVIVIDVTKTGIDKDNPTIDAALFVPCLKPAAGTDAAICQGITTIDLKNADTEEAWSKGPQPANTTASINAATGLVTGLSSPGDYYFILTYKANATCSDTVKVTVNAKPNAGPDMTGGNAICNSLASADLHDAANGETWTQLGTAPKVVTINPSTGIVTGMDVVGTYQFILKNTATNCADTVSVEVKNCLKGSLGDLVWKDANDNGIQDLPAEKGVKGVIVQLLNGDNNSLITADTTDSAGIYSFTGLDSGNYKVKIVLSSLPDTCQISPKLDVNTGDGNDTNDSDFNPTTGESPVIEINTLGSGIDKDNPTIDAALIIPCIKTLWNFAAAPVCSPNAAVYSVAFSIANKKAHLKVNAGTLSGNNPYTVTGIPNGTNLIITDSLRANCVFDTTISAPDCSCPQVNLLTPNTTACIGDTLPTLKVTLIGANTNGVSADWYANASGGTALASGLSFKPAGIISATDTFFVELTGVSGNCLNLPRTAIVVTAQNCQVDLALKKSINTKIARLGDTLTYTIKVWNEFTNAASGVEVIDSIATTVQFQAGSFTASRGSASITGNIIKWTIGNIAANGDTVTLTYKVKATQEGVHFNTAEISKTNEKDKDSTPGNGKDDEDDLDRQCFTVPVKLCPGEKVEVSIPAKYTNVQWFKNGGSTPVASGNQVLFSETGQYTFTASNNTCPAEGCCPVIIEPGDNCCPEDLCIPFTIKQTKKAGKKI